LLHCIAYLSWHLPAHLTLALHLRRARGGKRGIAFSPCLSHATDRRSGKGWTSWSCQQEAVNRLLDWRPLSATTLHRCYIMRIFRVGLLHRTLIMQVALGSYVAPPGFCDRSDLAASRQFCPAWKAEASRTRRPCFCPSGVRTFIFHFRGFRWTWIGSKEE
jgi:hypothetical protein